MNQEFYNKWGHTARELERCVEESLQNAEKVKQQFGTFYNDNYAYGRLGILGDVARRLGYKVKYDKDWIGESHLSLIKIPVESEGFSLLPRYVSLRFNTKFYRDYGLKQIEFPSNVDMKDAENKILNLMKLYDELADTFSEEGPSSKVIEMENRIILKNPKVRKSLSKV